MRTNPLRHRLILLVAVAIVPLAIMSGIGLAALLRQQSHATEQAAMNLTRALATAVDNELRSTVSALQTLALAPDIGSLDAREQARAHVLAHEVLASRPEWLAVLLLKPDAQLVFSTGVPYGRPQGTAVEPASVAEVAKSSAPVVGALRRGPLGALGVPVRVPVVRDGQLRYVLTAVVRSGGDPARRSASSASPRTGSSRYSMPTVRGSRARASTIASSAARRRRRCCR